MRLSAKLIINRAITELILFLLFTTLIFDKNVSQKKKTDHPKLKKRNTLFFCENVCV